MERRDSQIEYYGAQPNLEEMRIKYYILYIYIYFLDLRNYIELEPPFVDHCYLFILVQCHFDDGHERRK